MCIVPRPARKFHCCLVQRRGCVQEGAKLARENHVDLILAVGGGSVSDCCKVVSAQAKADFAFLDPTYSLSVPFKQVISGAFDTLSHAMETYFGIPADADSTVLTGGCCKKLSREELLDILNECR